MKRCGGVLCHISSLPGKYGIGTLGEGARLFVDFLKESGFGLWQILPVGPCDFYNSPYSGESLFAGNVLFTDPGILFEKGLITKDELESAEFSDIYVTQYDALKKTRPALFRAAFGRISESDREEICAFDRENTWLHGYALYRAIKDRFSGAPWYEWEKPYRMRDKKALSLFEKEHAEDIFYHKFLQWEFSRQWASLKEYANKSGVGIVGDMPIYPAYDSADVWYNPQLFMLDDDLSLTHCAGVPPDYFCADGQLWGNPLYNWNEMEKTSYRFWLDRIKLTLTRCDAVRIDHFRAFCAYWAIPAGQSAKNGRWLPGPGMKLFNAVKKELKNPNIIAEDLGDIDDDVRSLLKESGFPGMGVMQFAFISDGDSVHLPHNYSRHTVAYTGTHDNTTILGWLWESTPESRNYALSYCGFEGDWGQGGPGSLVIRSIIRTLWRSSALSAIVPVQDLCGFGGDTCMNHPGTAEDNWCFRLTKDALGSIDKDFYKSLNGLYKRGRFV